MSETKCYDSDAGLWEKLQAERAAHAQTQARLAEAERLLRQARAAILHERPHAKAVFEIEAFLGATDSAEPREDEAHG